MPVNRKYPFGVRKYPKINRFYPAYNINLAESSGGSGGGGGVSYISAAKWRLVFENGDIYVTEVTFNSTPSGSSVMSGVTCTASSTGGGSPSNVVDSNSGTSWNSGTQSSSSLSFSWAAPVTIAEVVLASTTGQSANAPNYVQLQYSLDGGATYTTYAHWFPTWTNGEIKTLTVPNVGASAAYWRVRFISGSGAQYGSCAELQLRTSVGGSQAASGGTASGDDSGGSAASNAFDANGSTFWATSDGNYHHWLQYQNPTALAVLQIQWQARNDGFYNESPSTLVVLKSDDGINFLGAGDFTAAGWSAGATQAFTLP